VTVVANDYQINLTDSQTSSPLDRCQQPSVLDALGHVSAISGARRRSVLMMRETSVPAIIICVKVPPAAPADSHRKTTGSEFRCSSISSSISEMMRQLSKCRYARPASITLLHSVQLHSITHVREDVLTIAITLDTIRRMAGMSRGPQNLKHICRIHTLRSYCD